MHCKLKLFILVSSVLPTELSLHPQMDDKQSLPVNVTHGSLSAITEVKFHSGTFSCHHSVASCVSSYWRRGGFQRKCIFVTPGCDELRSICMPSVYLCGGPCASVNRAGYTSLPSDQKWVLTSSRCCRSISPLHQACFPFFHAGFFLREVTCKAKCHHTSMSSVFLCVFSKKSSS